MRCARKLWGNLFLKLEDVSMAEAFELEDLVYEYGEMPSSYCVV